MEGWGVELSTFRIDRGNFRLEIENLLPIEAGASLNRLPIMGPSGSGKSTLMNGLAGITRPSNAKAHVRWRFPDGVEMSWGQSGPSPRDGLELRRRYFGFAFQSAAMQPHLTLGQNLINFLILCDVAPDEARRRALVSLERVMPDHAPDSLLRRYFGELSGGQKQRVALVQSMIHDPAVLFADEPTGSLDADTRRMVMSVLTQWVDRDPGRRLLIWVTHHESDPSENDAHHRIVLNNGRCEIEPTGSATRLSGAGKVRA